MKDNSILDVYETVRLIGINKPDYDPDKRPFLDAVYLFANGLKYCPAVNSAVIIRRLEREIKEAKLYNDDLKEDMKVLRGRIAKFKKQQNEHIQFIQKEKA